MHYSGIVSGCSRTSDGNALLRVASFVTWPSCIMHSAGHVLMKPFILPWAPEVVQETIPAGAPYSEHPVVVYASSNDFVYNFGHALFDFMYPVFNMLQTLQLYTPDFQLLLAQHQVIMFSYFMYFTTKSFTTLMLIHRPWIFHAPTSGIMPLSFITDPCAQEVVLSMSLKLFYHTDDSPGPCNILSLAVMSSMLVPVPAGFWPVAWQGVNPGVTNNLINHADPGRALMRLISRTLALPVHEFWVPGSEGAGLTCVRALVAGSVDMHAVHARVRALPFRHNTLPRETRQSLQHG
jgi:hypothetical protein